MGGLGRMSNNGHTNVSTNGNGHVHKLNGKHNINKNGKKSTSNEIVQTAAIKSNGSPTKMSKLLGITKSTASHHLQKPEIKKLVLDEREKALKKAGISRVRVYKKINANLDATIPQLQTHAIDRSLELLGDINNKDKNLEGAKNIFNFFIPTKEPIQELIDAEIANEQ